MTELDQLLQQRRSVRLYTDAPVPEETVEQIIAAGCWAPTACNKQEYAFLYLDDPQMLSALQKLGAAAFVSKAHQAVLVLYGNQTDNIEYHDDVLSAGAVIQNMLLKAHELGVGACEICNLPAKSALRRLFGVPKGLDPIALITLGYPARIPQQMPRKQPLDQLISRNRFEQDVTAWKRKPFSFRLRKLARSIFIRMPKTKWMLAMLNKVEKKFDN